MGADVLKFYPLKSCAGQARFLCLALALGLLAGLLLVPVLPANAESLKGETESTANIRQTGDVEVQAPEKKRYLIEFYANREFISDGFGNWDSGGMRLTRSGEGHAWYMELNAYNRKDGDGSAGQIVAGLYKDWTDWLYTFTSMSSGTNVDFLPRFRADQDFNFKLTEKRNIVWTLGGTFISYYNNSSDTILSTALNYYLPGWIFGGRYFYNISNPGALKSSSYSLSVDQGYWNRYMNTVIVSWGKQAYYATYLDSPQEVKRESTSVLLRHRNWIDEDWGFWVQGGYLSIKNGYHGESLGMGLFFYY